MKNLLKKKSRIKVLLERSEPIQFILCLLAMVLLCILNYLAAKWECSLAIPDTNSGLFYSLLLITFMAGNIVGLFLLLCILLVLKYAVVSTLTKWIRQFRALNNYCYIPLTEDEGAASALLLPESISATSVKCCTTGEKTMKKNLRNMFS